MTDTDMRARLRVLAEAIPREQWHAPGLCEVHRPDHLLIADTNTASLNGPDDAMPHADDQRRAEYIAAASPDALLALLDALDKAERERDALAADARRWQAIDAHWRTAQCYFRKDATNSIRAVQMFIDFDHRNDGKALGGVVDEAIAALAAREPT